ncbi:MAG: endolytic transglycosylase MltG [Spirochaetaceae bacterium]|nr:MAG: endolytic transglycosylase MltG [Spirochaetaceae bacterium]
MNDRRRSPSPRPIVRLVAVLALSGVIVLVVAIVAAVAAAHLTSGLLFQPAGLSGPVFDAERDDVDAVVSEIVFEIRPNQTLRTISRNMVDLGLARNALVIEVYGRFREYDRRLQAGRYLVTPTMAPVEIIEKIIAGDAVFDELTITIPEGWTVVQIADHLDRVGLFTADRFLEAALMQDAYRDFALLSDLPDGKILDGYLFPDTYRIFADSTPESVVRRMLSNLHARFTAGMLAQAAERGMSAHEVLTLASIVQAEAGGAYQMADVAGVFSNRLRDRIRLESDATVNYALGTSKRQPTFADVAVQHPYNTYQNFGLPPGPIGSPGMDAIRATIAPNVHDFFFFLHPPDRRIVLSRTFAEHLQNKARYLD